MASQLSLVADFGGFDRRRNIRKACITSQSRAQGRSGGQQCRKRGLRSYPAVHVATDTDRCSTSLDVSHISQSPGRTAVKRSALATSAVALNAGPWIPVIRCETQVQLADSGLGAAGIGDPDHGQLDLLPARACDLEQGTLHTARTLSESGGIAKFQRRDGLQSLAVATNSDKKTSPRFHRKRSGWSIPRHRRAHD